MKKSIGLACLAALMLTGCRVTVITDSTESTTPSAVSTVESVSTETFEEKLTDNGFTSKVRIRPRCMMPVTPMMPC
ncbi:MAG: hypothetical protein LKM30_04165 [Bacilli bacterium]|nr:hypothetical protein [Bacilli bacterium]